MDSAASLHRNRTTRAVTATVPPTARSVWLAARPSPPVPPATSVTVVVSLTCPPWPVLSTSSGGRPLESQFRLQVLQIALHGRDRQGLAATEVGDLAVAVLERALHPGRVPLLGVTQIADGDVVVLTPEERYSGELLASPEDVARGDLT